MSIHVRPQSLTKARCRALRISVPIKPHATARACLEAQIEFLIALLDQADPDPDIEETGDLEPSLGFNLGPADSADLEMDTSDNEPSLGSFDRMTNQEKSYRQTSWHCGEDLDVDRCRSHGRF